ncbi:RNA polymerase sporulation sigma factor SigK [[Clostridium] fimetarium]|uniref:RNA polymerase sigma factor n=1 Tax=[Clostridium] fimetarium TaxID=99656 RepID=A0A1I0N1P0_9FIRM|nr:RNA polymerase sporulation sigma factor SigK [[Clostridium] fimetarium]SEV94268.1 RNA polymerase sporulation-specific sigma factor [[Clostridium] fimetarium]
MKTFEKPLSEEEEKLYLQKYKEGDLEAKNILIEKNMRLVAHMVKKYVTNDRNIEDLLSVGTIGLIKAVNTFDSTKSCRLATYAAKCIDNELLMMLRSEKRKAREVSIYEPIGTDKEGNEISLIEIVKADDVDVVEEYVLRQNISKVFQFIDELLTEREREIIILRYGLYGHDEITQRELAMKLNISRSYVSRIEKKALRKLREKF